MDNENVLEIVKTDDVVSDELLPAEIDEMPLTTETNKLVSDIIDTTDVNELKELTKMFTLTQAKKNALRIVKLNTLLDLFN